MHLPYTQRFFVCPFAYMHPGVGVFVGEVFVLFVGQVGM
jgi:hypothetical protein